MILLKKKKNVGFGLPCYTFRNTCNENPAVSLDDKSIKVIYNASAYEAVKDEKVRDFLHFIMTNDPGENDFNKLLAETVKRLKENDEFRSDYTAMNLHDRDIKKAAREEGIAVGLLQGQQEKAIEDARSFYANGVSIELIAKSLNMTVERVKKIVSEEAESPVHA